MIRVSKSCARKRSLDVSSCSEALLIYKARRLDTTECSKALAKREDAPLAVTPVEAVAMSMQQRGERHIERIAGVSERAVDHIETMGGPEILNSVDQIEKLDKVARRTFRLDDNPLPAGFTLNVLNINSLDAQIQRTSD
jgi:hypothetical protein